jgi:hypothetical protein
MAIGTSPNPLIKSTTAGLETQKWGGGEIKFFQGDHRKLTVRDWVNQAKVSSAPCFHTSRSLQNRQKWIKAVCFKTALLNSR